MNQPTQKRVEEIVVWCSRCGGKYLTMGRVLRWGKHYPAYIIKKADGTTEERPAGTEIKEALCRECAKEHYDNEKISELSKALSQHEEETYQKGFIAGADLTGRIFSEIKHFISKEK